MEWISVKDKLPTEEDNMYLVSVISPSGKLRTTFCRWENRRPYYKPAKWNWIRREVVSIKDITHWMPLPEPPKE